MPSCPVLCFSCGQRKGRRDCPALGAAICTVCCGTKRQVEIACRPDCAYLASAREHPAAVVRRKREQDAAELIPTIRHLTERQYQLFFVFQTTITRYKPTGLSRLIDSDVAEAAQAVAATLETSARGVIYEHTPPGSAAQGLAAELKRTLAEIREHGARVFDHECAVVLRAIEKGARSAGTAQDAGTKYLDLLSRLLQASGMEAATVSSAAGSESPLILP
jgi:hypothetical protein